MLLVSCRCDRSQNLIPLGPQWAAGHGPGCAPAAGTAGQGTRCLERLCSPHPRRSSGPE